MERIVFGHRFICELLCSVLMSHTKYIIRVQLAFQNVLQVVEPSGLLNNSKLKTTSSSDLSVSKVKLTEGLNEIFLSLERGR